MYIGVNATRTLDQECPLEKTFIKKTKEWVYWELASVTTAESEQATLACSGCEDASVQAKDAMRSGWIRMVCMGATEPKSESEANGRSTYACPGCQMPIGIDIETSYAKRPAPPQQRQGSRGRPQRRSPNRRNRQK